MTLAEQIAALRAQLAQVGSQILEMERRRLVLEGAVAALVEREGLDEQERKKIAEQPEGIESREQSGANPGSVSES